MLIIYIQICKVNHEHYCKDTFCSQSPNDRSTAQRAQNNEFVESGRETELLMS